MKHFVHKYRLTRLAAVMACSLVTTGASASTMDALLEGNALQLTYADGATVEVRFEADGTYRTSKGSSGTWTLDGEALCTVRRSDSHASCGVLDRNKSVGEVWPSTDAQGTPVTASVMPVT